MTGLLLWAALACFVYAWLASAQGRDQGLPLRFCIPIFLGLFFFSVGVIWFFVSGILRLVMHG